MFFNGDNVSIVNFLGLQVRDPGVPLVWKQRSSTLWDRFSCDALSFSGCLKSALCRRKITLCFTRTYSRCCGCPGPLNCICLGALFVRSLRYPAGQTLRTCRGMAVKTFLTVNMGISHRKFGPSLENSRDLNVGCKIVDCTALSHQLVFSGNKGASSASPVATILFFSLYILITAWVIMVRSLCYELSVIRSVQSSLWEITYAVG